MQVNFYGTYRLITGQKTIEFIKLQEDTVLGLLHALVVKFPTLKHEILDENGNLYPYIPLYINGRNPRLLENGVHTVLNPQDVLSLFSPISSGHINVEDVKKLLREEESSKEV